MRTIEMSKMNRKRVIVLMSTYNGEKYIRDQLESILRQECVDVQINIRDDGSSDSTWSIISEYANSHSNVFVTQGENLGYAKSFWRLLQDAEEADYYAFCDQDDIWDNDKLISAVNLLSKQNEAIPLLYTSRVLSVNNSGSVLSYNCFNTDGVINLYESLQRSIIPGCVFVFNLASKEIVQKFHGFMESHDWATYAIISLFGKVVYDNESHIKYRIHGNNAIGQENSFGVFKKRLERLTKPSKRVRSKFARDLLKTYSDMIQDDDVKLNIMILAQCNDSLACRIRLAMNKNYRGAFFKIYALLGRI